MTKHAIVGFTKCLIAEAKDLNIRVTLVCPGYVDTDIYESCELNKLDREQVIPLVEFNMMTTQKAARKILKGVACNESLVVFPFHAKIFWVINRLFPVFFIKMSAIYVKKFRKVRKGV